MQWLYLNVYYVICDLKCVYLTIQEARGKRDFALFKAYMYDYA